MLRVLVLALVFVCAGVVRGQETGELGRKLDDAVKRAKLGQFWGGVLVVKEGSTLLARGYGYANEELHAITADHLFDIASCSKMFTAAAVLKLESMGKLGTADTIADFFPDAGAAADEITLQHLMTHTSGKSDSNGAIQPLNFADREGAVKKFVESRANGKPGERFEYCNGGYVVLAAVIEKASGMKFEEAVRELVLERAGMGSSGFLDGAGVDASMQTMRVTSMQGRSERRGLMLDKKVEPWAWGLRGAGGLVTTLNDLAKWDGAIRANAVLDAPQTEKWTRVEQANYACGWMVETDAAGRGKHSHGGATRGYTCMLVRYPAEGVFIAVLTNEGGRPDQILEAVTSVVWPREAGAATTATLNFVPELLTQYMSVVAETGKVEVKREGARVRVIAGDGTRMLAMVDMPPGAAKGLAAQIRSGLKGSSHRAAPEGGIKVGIFGMAHGVTKEAPSLRIEDGAWSVMPGYRGQGTDGKVISDPRLVLLLTDAANPGAWPLMVHVDDGEAERIARELEGAGK